MKPAGSTALKKRRSSALSSSPAQPRMTAPGIFSAAAVALSGNDTLDVALFQLAADPLGGTRVGNGPCLDAVIDPLFAEIGADRARREATEQIGILALDAFPSLPRRILAA